MPTANKIGIKQAPLDRPLTTRCVVRDRILKHTAQGKPYLELEIGDHSGRLKARLWERFEKWQAVLIPGTIIQIECTPYEYNGRRELKIHRLKVVDATSEKDYLEFLPRYPGDAAALRQRWEEAVAAITHPHWKALLQHFMTHEALLEKYFLVPAGKLWHHVYLGGLAHHVVSMLHLAQPLLQEYPQLDDQLLKTGIIFHDVGKIWCFDFSKGYIDYNTEGRLLGHVVLGANFVSRLMQDIELPRAYRTALLHLILSHPGNREEGAPVLPQTREAMALWLLNEVDKKLNATERILQMDVTSPDGWSKYSPLLERFLYRGFDELNATPTIPADDT